MKKKIFNVSLLTFGTMIWGSAFVFQDLGMLYVEPLTFNVFRCFACTIFLIFISFVLGQIKKKKKIKSTLYKLKDLIIGGLIVGVLTGGAIATQQIGISLEGAGKSGFITSLYIILVPLIGLIFGKKVNPFILIAIVFSLTGLFLINYDGSGFNFSEGTWWLLGCALLYALQILAISYYTNKCDSIKLTIVQFLVAGVIEIPFMFIFETPNIQNVMNAIIPILYCGILSSGIGFTIQVYTQKQIEPTIASMIMALESVFAIIFSIIFLGDEYTLKETLGCIAIFVSVIITQLPIDKLKIRRN